VDSTQFQLLLQSAVGGDRTAAGRVMLQIRPRLIAYIQRHLPRSLIRLVEPSDILQDAQIEAFRRMESFSDNGNDSFYAWLVQIARRQMLQYLRARRTLKRGGGLNSEQSSEFLEQLALNTHTPSQSVVRHELAFAVETCLQRIPPDYALAIRLRHLDRLTFAEVADRMHRTERAAQMLCNRGMKQLKEQLRSMSRFA
jgi:RNA polymerase sigma-70 factor (ECF subfamily)